MSNFWLDNSEKDCISLHIGDKIKLEEYGITIPSYRYSYKNIKDLYIFTHDKYAIIYTKHCNNHDIPICDIWKYIIKQQTVPGIIYTKYLKFPKDQDIYHAERVFSLPYSPEEIIYIDNTFVIRWNSDHECIFDISSETIVKEDYPVRTMTCSNMLNYGDYQINYIDKSEYVDVFYQNKFKYRLNHNTYQNYRTCTILEIYKSYIIINHKHGLLGVYDIVTGKLLHEIIGETGDEFFMHKYRIQEDSKEYLVLYGFIWAPAYFIAIYDLDLIISNNLDLMISDNSYEPEQYWEKDFSKLEAINIEKTIWFDIDIKTFKTYIKDKQAKELFEKQELLNQRWLFTENNFIRYALSEYKIDSEIIKNDILSLQTCPHITCHGGISGSEFKENAEDIIIKEFNGNIIDFFGNIILHCDNYKTYSEIGLGLKEVNLIFVIHDILKIHIVIPMKKIEGKETYWFPESDNKDYIKI